MANGSPMRSMGKRRASMRRRASSDGRGSVVAMGFNSLSGAPLQRPSLPAGQL